MLGRKPWTSLAEVPRRVYLTEAFEAELPIACIADHPIILTDFNVNLVTGLIRTSARSGED